jgi:hypothetical protein
VSTLASARTFAKPQRESSGKRPRSNHAFPTDPFLKYLSRGQKTDTSTPASLRKSPTSWDLSLCSGTQIAKLLEVAALGRILIPFPRNSVILIRPVSHAPRRECDPWWAAYGDKRPFACPIQTAPLPVISIAYLTAVNLMGRSRSTAFPRWTYHCL